jgi:16S rRNA (uracil1498-N3)-methyltransferase
MFGLTRFFVRPEQIVAGEVTLDADDAHHLRAVLKAKAGDRVAVLDGTGREYDAALTEIGKTQARASIAAERMLATESRACVTVAQALPKMAEKMEQVLQKGVELGACTFWCYQSARSQGHLTGDRQAKRVTRWEAIIKTAAEQSHRAILPALRVDQSFGDVIGQAPAFDLALFPYECERETTLREAIDALPAKPESILIVIGPEGGFAADEAALARSQGLVTVSLGPRILRTETAALVVLSQLAYALEG